MNIEHYAKGVLVELSTKDRRMLVSIGDKGDLISLHSTLGRAIRNRFSLWSISWKPEFVDGVDHSPQHPDAVSMRVIEQVYYMLKHTLKIGTVSSTLNEIRQ